MQHILNISIHSGESILILWFGSFLSWECWTNELQMFLFKQKGLVAVRKFANFIVGSVTKRNC